MANHEAVLREHGLGSAGEYTTEEPVVAIGVFGAVLDVQPLPISTVGLWIELELAVVACWRHNNMADSFLVEDDRVFCLGGLVSRVFDQLRVCACSSPDVRRNLSPDLVRRSACEVVTWRMHVVGEPEALEHFLHAERKKKFRDAVAPTKVLPILGLLSDHLAGFHTDDSHERRASVHGSVGFLACPGTNRACIEAFQDAASQTGCRGCLGEVAADRFKPSGSGSDELVRAKPDILSAIAVDPDLTGILRENLHHVGELLLCLIGRHKVGQADVGRLKRSLLEVILRKLVGDLQALHRRNTSSASRAVRNFYVFPCKSVLGKRAAHGEDTQRSSHTFGPRLLFREVEPDACVKAARIDFGRNLVLQADHDVVDVWCCHNSKCVKS